MFFVISKLLSLFLHPFTWVFILLLTALIFQRKRKKLLICSILFLYFFSNAFIFDEFNRLWEIDVVPQTALKENYDVAIILGGMVTYDEKNGLIGFHEASDRLFHAIPMYYTNKINKIMISGGSGSLIEEMLEADILKQYLVKISIPEEDIYSENESRNTYENAVSTYDLLINRNFSNGNFLLITSASHMRRAKACFEKSGLQFDIFPVDHISGPRKYVFDHLFLPQNHIMDSWKRLFHEWVGFITYKIMGYC